MSPRWGARPRRAPLPYRAWHRVLLVLALCLATAGPSRAWAHDPSAWGGVYRSRDNGATWMLANEGRFVTAALGVAIDPGDSSHLLLATDSGLLRSRNGGRDWEVDGQGALIGGVYAVAFDASGRWALAATSRALFVREEGQDAPADTAWRPVEAPAGAAPARAIVVTTGMSTVYLVGWNGLYRSDDWGVRWASAGAGLPNGSAAVLIPLAGSAEGLLAVAEGGLWASGDGGRSWQPRDNGLPSGRVDTAAADLFHAERLWAAGADHLFRSDDRGATWHPHGTLLPERETTIRGIGVAVDGASIVLTTDRGLYRGTGDGSAWELLADNVPSHLEARPLVRDPKDPSTLYAGFSITPYEGIWQTAADGRSVWSRLDGIDLAGGAAFLAALLLAAGWVLRRLGRYYGPMGDGPRAASTDDAPAGRAGGIRLAERAAR